MMKTTNRPDGPPWRPLAIPSRRRTSSGLALLGLALVGLMQAGCRLDGCSNCTLGSTLGKGVRAVGTGFKAVGAFVFHHKHGCGGGSDCGCGGSVMGGEEGLVVDSGIPVVPGGMAIPAPGTILPPPSIESGPTQLEAIPKDVTPSPTSGTGASSTKPSTTRSTPAASSRPGYTTSLPKTGASARRNSETAQAMYSTSEGTGKGASAGPAADLIENIPPVDLPSEVTRKAVSPTASPTPVPAPEADSPTPTPAPAEKVSAAAADGISFSLPPINNVVAAQAPGLRRYASIAPTIGGGSAPSVVGLDWLKEKGYRTLVDLRKGSEIDPEFVEAVNDHGMVYISLPVLATRLDPARLARFDDLLSRPENRPLFFCDTDGTRAALLWYVHQRVIAQEDPQAARAKAEELGLTDLEARTAEDYIAGQKPKAKSALVEPTRIASAITEEPKAAEPQATQAAPVPAALPSLESSAITAPVAPPAIDDAATPSMLPGEHRPQAARAPVPDYREPGAWKPAAALVLTSIGVPLACWSRSLFSEFRQVRRRASLPGPGPQPRSLPPGLDA